jgi:hypothetical protein
MAERTLAVRKQESAKCHHLIEINRGLLDSGIPTPGARGAGGNRGIKTSPLGEIERESVATMETGSSGNRP